LSSLIPKTNGNITNPQAFNASNGELKLGPVPLAEELRTEMERVLREQAILDRDPAAQYDLHYLRPPTVPGVNAPSESDLLPRPPTFKTIDVKREVESVRDIRKRIRLDPSALTNVDINAPQASSLRARALPSICAYTLHDVAEGFVICGMLMTWSLNMLQFTLLYLFSRQFHFSRRILRELHSSMEFER
jgi:transcription initiation factor TFIID subunit 5